MLLAAAADQVHRSALHAELFDNPAGKRDQFFFIKGFVDEAEFRLAAALPQEIRVQRFRLRLRLLHEADQRRFELEQHVGGLDLGTLAAHRLDLQRAGVLGHHRGDLEAAFFFVKNVQIKSLYLRAGASEGRILRGYAAMIHAHHANYRDNCRPGDHHA